MLLLGHGPHYIGPPLGIIHEAAKQFAACGRFRLCRMTIALGLLAHRGVVIAADREQSDGTLKSDQGKIQTGWVRNRGSIAISGAGNGPYLDSLSSDLMDWFSNDKTQFEVDKFGEELRSKNHDFYQRSVLPFAPYLESVDYELLVALAPAPTVEEIALAKELGGLPGKHPNLWTSHKLSVLKEEPFAAVGVGRTTANSLLLKYWVPSLPLEIAATLATYIVYQVKRTVKDVGLETDVLVISGGLPHHLTRQEISAMEARFSEYEDAERENLFYCFGGDLTQLEKVEGKVGDHCCPVKAQGSGCK
jgi:hypothetical protein